MNETTSREETESDCEKSENTRSWTAYVYALLASLFAATGGLLTKIAVEDKMLIVLMRSMMQFLILLPMTTYKKIDVLGSNAKTLILLILRGVLGSIGMNTYAEALKYLPLGDVGAIVYTNPILVTLFACICLREHCGILNGVLTVVTLIGFTLVAQPSFIFGESAHDEHLEGLRWLGIIYALTCSISAALVGVIVRKLGLKVHYSLSLLYYAWENAFIVVSFKLLTGQTLSFCSNHLGITISAGLTMFIAQALTTLALQREKAGPVSLIRSSEVVFMYLFQYIVMGEIPTLLGGIGAGLILCVCVMLSIKSIWKAVKVKS